jgi:methylmalonyl-CoA mutase N-terminal domain/subunit
VRRRLTALVEASRGTGNLIGPMLEAARAEATMGEICNVLRDEWGEYREPARF